jgi:hypothetical protein
MMDFKLTLNSRCSTLTADIQADFPGIFELRFEKQDSGESRWIDGD